MTDASAEQRAQFAQAQREYWDERATKEKSTNFGATYSYHYRDLQKQHRAEDAPVEAHEEAPAG